MFHLLLSLESNPVKKIIEEFSEISTENFKYS